MCAVFDEFLKMDLSSLDVDKCAEAWPSLEEEQQRALGIFRDFPAPLLGYTEITKKYDDAATVRRQLETVRDSWPSFRDRLRAQVYSFDKMKARLKAASAPCCP